MVVVGAGPTGLMLAGELALAGVDVALVERRATQELVGSRARGLHARTIEVLDQRGIAGGFLAAGRTAQFGTFAGVPLDVADAPTRHPYGLALSQREVERLLAAWVDGLPGTVHRGREVTGLAQDADGVDVALSDGSTLRAAFVVGCDGGRSLVRKAAGIAFPGADPTSSSLIAEVEMTTEPELGVHHGAFGIHAYSRATDGRGNGEALPGTGAAIRVLVTEQHVGPSSPPTMDDLRAALIAVDGTDHGAHSPRWISRFTDAARQAAAYRHGRVLLAGDAAHVHPPDGGQGLQLGLQDAVNLGWKLGQVVRGASPASLLDSYHDERHPVGAGVLRTTMASTALRRSDDRTTALRETVAELLDGEEPRRRLAARMAGLDTRYDLGDGHPLLGCRMPDLDLATDAGPVRLFELLQEARPVLLDLTVPRSLDPGAWSDRVRLVEATFDGVWELPDVGPVDAPTGVLVRPDGHVAWVGESGATVGLGDALARWFGTDGD